MILCPCGKPKLPSGDKNQYLVRSFDKNGTLVFAICHHGTVVIDKTGPDVGKKDHDAHPKFARKSTLMKR